jgi:hypothetical protein
MALRKLPEAFGLSVTKGWYPHHFNTKANLDYVGPLPGIEHYGVADMSEAERIDFMVWYDAQKGTVFNNRRMLEQYCQADVTVLRQACQIFRKDFMVVGNVDVFLESCTIASACNKLLRKRFLKPETIGLIPSGGYTCNRPYSKKALMWLLHVEETDGCSIQHHETVGNFDYPNCHNIAWTDTVQTLRQSWSFTVVSGTDIPVYRFAISRQWGAIRWPNGMNAPCRDWNG